jgi:hypothetical protein
MLTPADQRTDAELRDEFGLSVYDGAFDEALEVVKRWERATADVPDGARRALPTLWRIELDLEIGRSDDAARAARELATKSWGWLDSERYDSQMDVARVLYLTDEIPRDRFLTARAQIARDMATRGGSFEAEGTRWYEAFVRPARTAADAHDAIAQRPAHLTPDVSLREVETDARIGHMFAQGGDLPAATEALRRATGACTFDKAIAQMHAYADLGDTLRQSGDAAGACRAYAYVTKRWGHDGRSATARRAREEAAALDCGSRADGAP